MLVQYFNNKFEFFVQNCCEYLLINVSDSMLLNNYSKNIFFCRKIYLTYVKCS